MNGRIRLRAPIAEEIFLHFISICLDQERFLSILIRLSDLALSNCLITLPSKSILIFSLE
jgi:hypothetical protein